MNGTRTIIPAIIILLLAGCTGLRKLPEGELLYTGHSIAFDSAALLTSKRATQSELEGLVRPSPNTTFLWMRPFLSIHNMVKEPEKEKGFKHWLKYRLGEPPVLISDLQTGQINSAIVNRLENRGYFQAGSHYEIQKKKRTATVQFFVELHQPYTLRSVAFPDETDVLTARIAELEEESLIKRGDQYNLANFRRERDRIDNILKNQGYFFFNPGFLLFEADTTVGDRQIDVLLNVTNDKPRNARIPYRIGNIYVHDDVALTDYNPDTLRVDDFFYITNTGWIKPQTVLNSVFLSKDSLYSRRDHFNTLNNLMGLGIYRFANVRFNVNDRREGVLDASIFLTPLERKSLSAEANVAVKTNNFAGPGMRISFKNRNTFRGAELLAVNLGGRFESQLGGSFKGQTSYEFTLDASLTLPRIVPFRFEKKSREFISSTVMSVGGGIFSRVDLYRLHSSNISYGYNWKPGQKTGYQFNPVEISFTQLAKSSERFEQYLTENPNIRKSFEEQFILGSGFVVTLNNFYKPQRHTNYFYLAGIDVSGNVMQLANSIAQSPDYGEDNQYQLFGMAYSQFVRLRNDFRYFVKVGNQRQLAMRLQAAAGLPYGNSTTMPYVKQFFVGGTNSVRAFRARTVGPGIYQPADTIAGLFVDQAGDIKLEATIEYRFPIYSYFKGALFVDAGNIWLVNDDEQRPGGQFKINEFYRELAIGAGAGFRVDVEFFVIRFDLAMPLRKPYMPDNEKWVIGDFDPGSRNWRRENLILNIAIGYPF